MSFWQKIKQILGDEHYLKLEIKVFLIENQGQFLVKNID